MSKNKFVAQYFCVCDQFYSQKRQLRKHIRLCNYAQNPGGKCFLQYPVSKCELIYINGNQNPSNVRSTERFKCGCEKSFMSKGGYYRHIKKCQLRPKQQVVTGKTKCNEPGCLLTFKYIRDFRQHLNEKHQIQFDVEDKKFDTYSDFLNWKVNYESETCSCFYHRKNLTRSGRRVEYWYCNRSGSYQSALQSRRRKLKSQGILKINNNCTSSITLTVNKIDGTVQAVIHHTHYGHEAELIHLRIPKSDKQEIASKLLQGVNIEDILSSFKEDRLSKQTERKHLIKRRDILNISKKYNVNIILPKVQPSKNKTNYELVQKAVEPPVIDSLPNTTESNKRHFISSQLALSCVRQIHENIWRISMGNVLVSTVSSNSYNQEVYYVTKNDVVLCSTNYCDSYCNYCNICYHAYSCTCSDFLSKKIICEHVHLTEIFQANPETSQNEDHRERHVYGNEDHTKYTQNYTEPPNSQKPIQNGNQDHTKYTQKCTEPSNSQPIKNGNQDHTKYTRNYPESSISQQSIKNVKLCNHSENNDIYKLNMRAENLKNVKTRLKKLMMNTLRKIDECNNSDLLENLEKQITNISCNLERELLENATKKRNEVQNMLPEKKY
ncbi:unnamed protein product [Macrosiphum euphorbiae]|uniref:SWIM-type domain-containing protein n=1 Tax=Macrosiphum euphorbiae TaxID=13131 RepID=A0AAV0XHF1_9HEMI|nr:unnamed protein product [Macrosiphum euphorbiae]